MTPVMKKNKKTNKRGFTLVEVLVAMFVFVLMATMLAASFGSFLKTYFNAKKLQKSTETAQYVMNLIAKTARTSMDINATVPGEIKMYDNSTGNCIYYKYVASSKKMLYGANQPATPGDRGTCAFPAPTSELTSDSIVAFKALHDDINGKLSLLCKVQETGQPNAISIESTVSIRN